MAENNNFRNFDLNLGPVEIYDDDDGDDDDDELMRGLDTDISRRVEDLFDSSAVPLRGVAQRRSHRWRTILRRIPIPTQRQSLSLQLIGEASAMPDGGAAEAAKICENCTSYAEDKKDLGAKKDSEKNNGDEGSFFDCNICLDLAMDPVVTCCGHMFCWPCLYRWLYHHSDSKKCPICKGGVTMKDVTPIYGRGSDRREPKLDSSLRIPPRPQACGIQDRKHVTARPALTFPMNEVIRQLEDAYDINRRLTAEIHAGNSTGMWESSPYRRVSVVRGINREQPPVIQDNGLNDTGGLHRGPEPAHFVAPNHRAHAIRRPRSAWLRPHRGASPAIGPLSFDVEYLNINNNPVERNHEADRDSVSSIAAAIHSEGQTVDNAAEIDSTVAHSTSSSTRRGNASRVSDVDSGGDSPAPWRRRLA